MSTKCPQIKVYESDQIDSTHMTFIFYISQEQIKVQINMFIEQKLNAKSRNKTAHN